MTLITITPPAHIHLIGICGTGMGALAGLLKARGYKVTGSDAGVYPPMSDALAALQIPVAEGYRPENLTPRPDLVVVGNICRQDHPEAAAAREQGIPFASFPRTVHDLFLAEREPIVIAGTHGKTTTTALTAYLLEATGRDPSILVGGVTHNFGNGFKLGNGRQFVIEGDEYDSAYFEKVPKFSFYAPHAAVITSVEHDHVDIYPTVESYEAAFSALAEQITEGPLAIYSGDEGARRVAANAECPVITYGVKGDPFEFEPTWLATPRGNSSFELQVEGISRGIFETPLPGRHNVRNVLAALIMAHSAAGVPLADLQKALPGFGGIDRRQQVIGTPGNITVYDDFAHHPTAVRCTLEALKSRHPGGRIIAAFEPRSATACRNLHQESYARAFDAADMAIIAPLGRSLPENESLDTTKLAADISARRIRAVAVKSIDEIVEIVLANARPGDGVALLSNGSFGAIHPKLVEALEKRFGGA